MGKYREIDFSDVSVDVSLSMSDVMDALVEDAGVEEIISFLREQHSNELEKVLNGEGTIDDIFEKLEGEYGHHDVMTAAYDKYFKDFLGVASKNEESAVEVMKSLKKYNRKNFLKALKVMIDETMDQYIACECPETT